MSSVISKSSINSIIASESWNRGLLLGGNPSNPADFLYKGVILLFHQVNSSILGLQLNRELSHISLSRIVSNLGFELSRELDNDVVYYGGALSTNRMHFVHSLDWFSSSTIVVNKSIGVTSDLSILSAICSNEGPRSYRACAGSWRWDLETLREQIFNLDPEVEPQAHLWEVASVSSSLVFDRSGEDQWSAVMRSSAESQSKGWMN